MGGCCHISNAGDDTGTKTLLNKLRGTLVVRHTCPASAYNILGAHRFFLRFR